jgi:hypothetical protein
VPALAPDWLRREQRDRHSPRERARVPVREQRLEPVRMDRRWLEPARVLLGQEPRERELLGQRGHRFPALARESAERRLVRAPERARLAWPPAPPERTGRRSLGPVRAQALVRALASWDVLVPE